MKMIFKVAKTELRNLFYSPVAWFLTIAFLVQCAVFYTYSLYPIALWQDMAVRNNPAFKDFASSLTAAVFLSPDGIFQNVLQNLYLYVPLLTMGLISREVNNGTIKLLYSSPIKVRTVVLGKYLAVMVYNLLLVLIVGVFVVAGIFNIQSVDYGILLSATLGFYLLVCAYSAIGLFMSSLTTYQVVSAIGSFTIIFALTRVGTLWQKMDFVRDLTYFLSLSGRTAKMVKGLITTKDILYFIVIVYMFLGFALLKLKGGRESKPWYVKAIRYAAIVVSALAVGYVSSRPVFIGYLDTTATQSNTLHLNTKAVVKELGKDSLEVTLYTNLLGRGVTQGLPENRNTYLSTLWDPYLRFKPDIVFHYERYYDYDPTSDDSALYRSFPHKNLKEIAEQMAGAYEANAADFKAPEDVHKTVDLQPEAYRLVMQLKYKGRTTFLRTFDDNTFWPEEQQIAAAFKRLLQARMPKIVFLTGDLERNIFKRGEREYRMHTVAKDVRSSLVNLGFDVDTLSLDNRDIPADVTALVLADPKTTLSEVALRKLRGYIYQGGNLLVTGEPGKQQMINPLLSLLGVQLIDGTLVEPTKDEMPQMVRPYLTPQAAGLAQETELLQMKETGQSETVLMPGVTGLSCNFNGPFTIKPLLLTLEQTTWLKKGTLVTDSADIVYSSGEGDQRGTFATAVALTRPVNNKEQRIVICGDADFLSTIRQGGGFFGRALYSWLDNGKFPIYGPKPKPKDARLRVSVAGSEALKIVLVWVLPGMVLLLGTVLLIRRKRQ